MNRNLFKMMFSLLVGGWLLLLTLRYFDLELTAAAIRGARKDLLLLALGLMVFAYLLRGKRWMIWEPQLNYWNSFKLILVGFMGNNILPARLGEILRAHCAAASIDNGFGRTATLASVAIERILDGFVIALIGIAGMAFVPPEGRLFWALGSVCVLFFLLTTALIAGIYFHERLRRMCDTVHRVFPGHLTNFGREKLNYFLDGLLMIRRPPTMAAALLATGLIWSMELVGYYLIARAVFPGAGFATSLVFLAVVNFASLFPFTVGGIGAIEGATAPFLIGAGIPLNESLAMVLLQHGFQFCFTTVLGGIFYFTAGYFKIPLVQRAPQPRQAAGEPSLPVDSEVLRDSRLSLDRLADELGVQRKAKDPLELSIVIPAYNERSRLPRTVLETITWCEANCPRYEILIIDDGSTDETLEIARLFSEYHDSITAIANPHMGKGAAVRTGMLNATGRHVLFMDADGATPLDEIPKLRARLDEGSPIAIGSRIAQRPGETLVVTSLHRKLIGRSFAAIVNVCGVSGIGDTQCGFKMFQREVVKEIFSRQKLNGFAFDVEILFLARRFSLTVSEVPVNWTNKEGSKVNLVLDSMRMLRDVLKLNVLHINT
jgi:dolichyl-phosphate beta-glucosyltransferase